MLPAVQLNREPRPAAGKINNIAPERMLAAKLMARKSPAAQKVPEPLLLFRHLPSQPARTVCNSVHSRSLPARRCVVTIIIQNRKRDSAFFSRYRRPELQ